MKLDYNFDLKFHKGKLPTSYEDMKKALEDYPNLEAWVWYNDWLINKLCFVRLLPEVDNGKVDYFDPAADDGVGQKFLDNVVGYTFININCIIDNLNEDTIES